MLSTGLRERGSAMESVLARRIGRPFRRAVPEPQCRTSRAGFAFPSSRASPRLNPHPSRTEGVRHPRVEMIWGFLATSWDSDYFLKASKMLARATSKLRIGTHILVRLAQSAELRS